ncbi:permease prefix domain 1-containing protein [Rhizobium sullae]|uniref:Uncharacterized protein n=1 Tax=Rhizobium sullae TaxID=50338 RepID=A0A4R3QEY5_RHISU|nr:permease prefix domain 1-containing protein [Rhizobium sullae]TCU18192.1 hypothetical protein EV132_103312 [Rhizobium sullae]
MPDPFDILRERLLRAGVGPRTVARYVTELREHLDDLTREMTASGLPEPEARERALVRLGGVDALALPMIIDRRFHSWASKAPWAVFLLVPILAYACTMVLTVAALASVTSPGSASSWFSTASLGARWLTGGLLPIIGAWLLALIAIRQRSRPLWPLLGMGATIVLATMITLAVSLPAPAQTGAIMIGVTLPSVLQILTLAAIVAAPLFLLPPSTRERFFHPRVHS